VRTGNAARERNRFDSYVLKRSRRLLAARYGSALHAGRAEAQAPDWLEGHCLHLNRATSATTEGGEHAKTTINHPRAGKPHVRVEWGRRQRPLVGTLWPLTTNES
jgi:hypothetical protein